MTRVLRRIFLACAILLFLTIAPLIILYAIGYRLSTEASPQVVGVLLIETEPRRADVIVEGKLLGRTPRAVSNLLPGIVDIRLTKEGFRPWAKKILIEAARASDFRQIRLFPISPVRDILATTITQFMMAPNGQLIAAITEKRQVTILDITGQTVVEPILVPAATEKILWSADSSQLLLLTNRQTYIMRLSDGQLTTLARLPEADVLGWDPRLPDRLLLREPGGEVIAYSTVTQTPLTLISASEMVATADNGLYVLADQQIHEYSYDGTLRRTFISTLPEKDVRTLIANNNGDVAVIYKNGDAAIVNEQTSVELPVKNISELKFSPDGTLLALQTAANEMQVYNYSNDRIPYIKPGEAHLITRLSRPLQHINWLGGIHYVFYEVEDQIVVSEIDTRDHIMAYPMDTTNVGNPYVIADEAGEFLYYLKKDAEGSHLVKTSLSEAETSE